MQGKEILSEVMNEQQKTLSTYEELYSALLSLDNENIMHKKDEECFSIKLDEEYDITVYDNMVGEVYLEYNAKGKQLTHYHPDYQDAYEALAEVIRNKVKELERLKKVAKASQKADRCMVVILIIIVLLLAAVWLFGGGN